jgi:uncharacterized protein
MEILHEGDEVRGRFYLKENGETVAEMTYKWKEDDVFVIEHTEVNEKLAGQGVGKQLVNAAVEFARYGKHRVIAVCPFARGVFEKTPAYQEVLYR